MTYRLTIRYRDHDEDYDVKEIVHDSEVEHSWTQSDSGVWEILVVDSDGTTEWAAVFTHLCSLVEVKLIEPDVPATQSAWTMPARANDETQIMHVVRDGDAQDPRAFVAPVPMPPRAGDQTQVIKTIAAITEDDITRVQPGVVRPLHSWPGEKSLIQKRLDDLPWNRGRSQ